MLNKSSEFQDNMAVQNNEGTLQDKLTSIHEVITTTFSFVDRISVAVYEPETDLLKIFMASCYGENPLSYNEAQLKDIPLLEKVMHKGKACVAKDLDIFSQDKKIHVLQMAELRYAASYIVPVYQHSKFFGFILFNSGQADVFEETTLHQMDLFGHMISLMVMNELSEVYSLRKRTKSSDDNTCNDVPETGSHVDRMSRYARLIAQTLADQYHYDLHSEYIDMVGLFSPLHDLGKSAIADEILLNQAN